LISLAPLMPASWYILGFAIANKSGRSIWENVRDNSEAMFSKHVFW
jgi:hypothetical protein